MGNGARREEGSVHRNDRCRDNRDQRGDDHVRGHNEHAASAEDATARTGAAVGRVGAISGLAAVRTRERIAAGQADEQQEQTRDQQATHRWIMP